MPHWSDPLLALLAHQPAETTSVALTLDELAVLAGGSLPRSVYSRSYWRTQTPRGMGARLRAIGWWMTRLYVEGYGTTITFMPYELAPRAARQDNGA